MSKYDNETYKKALEFKKKFPGTIAWRIKKHARIVNLHLNKDEKLLYVWTCQKNDNPFDIINTYVVALTDKRILMGRKRLLFGYFLDSITPDMFNDLNVISGISWGKLHIDTIKEYVTLSNLSKRALPEIETQVSAYMMKEKERLGGLRKD